MKTVVVYGVGPVLAAIQVGRRSVHELLVADGRRPDPRTLAIIEEAGRAGVRVRRVARLELDQTAGGGAHQGVAALVSPLPGVRLDALVAERPDGGPALVVALDGVQDPHNLGAVLRTAACVGADAVVVPRDRAARLTAAAVKVAEGAAEHIPVVEVTNLARALGQLRQARFWAIGLDGGAETRWMDVDLTVPTVLVLGGEGRGLRPLVRRACDIVARLDTPGPIDTMNVSAAAAMALYEAIRQRQPG